MKAEISRTVEEKTGIIMRPEDAVGVAEAVFLAAIDADEDVDAGDIASARMALEDVSTAMMDE